MSTGFKNDQAEDIDIIECNGCGSHDEWPSRRRRTEHNWMRRDYFGMVTGAYCDECFDSDAYPYRKDDYSDDMRQNGECMEDT